MNPKYLNNCGLLRLFDEFDDIEDSRSWTFEYYNRDDGLKSLEKRYGLANVAGQGDDWSRGVKLLMWLCENAHHKGMSYDSTPLNSLSILDYSFLKGKEGGVNCRKLATVLAEACLSVGLKARIASLHPLNPFDDDNHVVTLLWCSSFAKWVMLDPAFRAYITDAEGHALSPWEARYLLSLHGMVRCNAELWHNREPYKPEHYLTYITKNLFFMQSPLQNRFGSETLEARKWVWLIPHNFDAARRNAYNRLFLRQREKVPWDGQEVTRIVDDMVIQDKQRHIYTASTASFSKEPAR